jgi:hypothetical protein
MTRLGVLLFFASVTGCVGQVAGSQASGGGQPPPPVDECTMGSTQGCIQENGNVGSRACEVGENGYVWGTCKPASCTGKTLECVMPDMRKGVAQCTNGQSASGCGVANACMPGDTQAYGMFGCEMDCALQYDGTWNWATESCNTPLVLAFHHEHVDFTHAPGAFDLAGEAASVPTDWVSASTPWLAMDVDGDGRIEDGRELFGSMTLLPGGGRARDGFAALAALDDDGDGQITARDAAFASLVVWRDADQDRRSEPGELVPAADEGLVAIRLAYDIVPNCVNGNCERERTTFVYRDDRGREHEGDVIDVHLASR